MQRRSSTPPALTGYQFVRLLGSGGFSDVFLYDQSFPKRRVAVKVLLLEELTAESRASFTAEANVMAQLSAHPYIVTIFQAAVADDDRPYLVMEYCSGPSLADQYKKHPLSVTQVLEVGIRLCSAIATAHAAGILHRDIKPANVLTNQFGWPALTDFGIASTVDELAPTMTTTSRGSGGGTTGGGTASVGMSIPWSPPEMFDDVPNPDFRSDVFSLAATLYTVLEGHTPFEVPGRSNGSVDLIGRIARGSITPLSRSDVPSSLSAILHKGMASEPRDRFATAIDFGRALQRVEVELGFPQTPLDIPDLAIDVPERAAAGDEASADETRARVIPTVHAQAPVAPPAPTIVSAPPSFEQETAVRPRRTAVDDSTVDATQLRPTRQVEGETVRRGASQADAAESTTDDAHPRRRRRSAVISAIVAVVLVGGAIAVSAYVASGAKHPAAQSSESANNSTSNGPPTGEGSGPVTPSTPKGVLSSDGKSVVFSWTTSKLAKGDEYQWAQVKTDTQGSTTTVTSPTATVPYSGSPVCVRVWTVDPDDGSRSGAANGCYPA